jgi:hypothetical protein
MENVLHRFLFLKYKHMQMQVTLILNALFSIAEAKCIYFYNGQIVYFVESACKISHYERKERGVLHAVKTVSWLT